MKPLDLMTFPLDSLSLIEASAGTGKTYALANLYLRYLLEEKFSVEQILVVTFTEAATQELRDRIRARIIELGDLFDYVSLNVDGDLCAGDLLSNESDSILKALVAGSRDLSADRLRLRIAERQMDQAEIHTIHGFCQRLLREHAIESQVPLSQTLIEDLQPLMLQVTEDFWRKEILSMPDTHINFVTSCWREPSDLLQATRPLLNRRPECIIPSLLEGGLGAWQQQLTDAFAVIEAIKLHTQEVIDDLIACVASSQLKALKNKLRWLEQIRHWALDSSPSLVLPSTSSKPNLLVEFTRSKIISETKAKATPPEHAYFDYLENMLQQTPDLLKESFLVQTFGILQENVQRLKQEQQAFGFDDLILHVAKAVVSDKTIVPDSNEPNVELNKEPADLARFARTVRARYQCALIDEFQDTDKAQYQIFSHLFGPAANAEASRLVLIGDPKQAIYAFRGGDIATYLKAKAEVTAHPRGHVFTMDTNWRSSPAMVAAVNGIFSQSANPFMASAIPFLPVHAAKPVPDEVWGAALRIAQVPVESDGKGDEKSGLNKEAINDALAAICVREVQSLLSLNQAQNKSEGNSLGLKSSDIAILVRSGAEAEFIKQRLAYGGVRASYEGRLSIFETVEAHAVLLLLQAVAEPSNEFAIKRCLTELLFGFDDREFETMLSSPAHLTKIMTVFQLLHAQWLRSGVLAMIRLALQELKVLEHWQQAKFEISGAQLDWERSLSNVNQLAELLQLQSRKYRGHHALIHWLRSSVQTGQSGVDDESRLRLESDEQLVRITTIHKSKGLEYPVVFLPFLYSAKGASEAWYYDEQGRLSLDLSLQKGHLQRAEEERLAEDMRLLYVALTRAKYRCYVGTAAYKSKGKSLGLSQSAWGHILLSDKLTSDKPVLKITDELLADVLNELQHSAPEDIQVLNSSLASEQTLVSHRTASSYKSAQYNEGSVTRYAAKRLQQPLTHAWKVHSFTGLMHESHARHVNHESRQSSSAAVMSPFDQVMPVSARQTQCHILEFPRGSRAGTFLHTLFEALDFESNTLNTALNHRYISTEDYISELLANSHLVESRQQEAWARYLVHWLTSVLDYPLLSTISLSSLSTQDYQVEMDFHFPVQRLDVPGFNALLREVNPGADYLDFASFEGQLKGAIDLVFRSEGQYFVLDYKSNHLGHTAEEYLPQALEIAINDHRYDVQYLLYTLAVHRLLKHRLGSDYDYQRDFGGVLYLFLRGMGLEAKLNNQPSSVLDTEISTRHGNSSGVYFVKPPRAVIDTLDQLMGAYD